MKKLFALLLVAIILASMVACGFQEPDVVPTQTGETDSSTYESQTTEPTNLEGSLRDDTQKSDPAYFRFFKFMLK